MPHDMSTSAARSSRSRRVISSPLIANVIVYRHRIGRIVQSLQRLAQLRHQRKRGVAFVESRRKSCHLTRGVVLHRNDLSLPLVPLPLQAVAVGEQHSYLFMQ
jgi:hypothetical protein